MESSGSSNSLVDEGVSVSRSSSSLRFWCLGGGKGRAGTPVIVATDTV